MHLTLHGQASWRRGHRMICCYLMTSNDTNHWHYVWASLPAPNFNCRDWKKKGPQLWRQSKRYIGSSPNPDSFDNFTYYNNFYFCLTLSPSYSPCPKTTVYKVLRWAIRFPSYIYTWVHIKRGCQSLDRPHRTMGAAVYKSSSCQIISPTNHTGWRARLVQCSPCFQRSKRLCRISHSLPNLRQLRQPVTSRRQGCMDTWRIRRPSAPHLCYGSQGQSGHPGSKTTLQDWQQQLFGPQSRMMGPVPSWRASNALYNCGKKGAASVWLVALRHDARLFIEIRLYRSWIRDWRWEIFFHAARWPYWQQMVFCVRLDFGWKEGSAIIDYVAAFFLPKALMSYSPTHLKYETIPLVSKGF